jgi:hypothetical protein
MNIHMSFLWFALNCLHISEVKRLWISNRKDFFPLDTPLRNPPFSFSSFHCSRLWEAVRIIPLHLFFLKEQHFNCRCRWQTQINNTQYLNLPRYLTKLWIIDPKFGVTTNTQPLVCFIRIFFLAMFRTLQQISASTGVRLSPTYRLSKSQFRYWFY